MRQRAVLATALLALLMLTAACSGADAVLDPRADPGGGSPPETVGGDNQDLGGDNGPSSFGAK